MLARRCVRGGHSPALLVHMGGRSELTLLARVARSPPSDSTGQGELSKNRRDGRSAQCSPSCAAISAVWP